MHCILQSPWPYPASMYIRSLHSITTIDQLQCSLWSGSDAGFKVRWGAKSNACTQPGNFSECWRDWLIKEAVHLKKLELKKSIILDVFLDMVHRRQTCMTCNAIYVSKHAINLALRNIQMRPWKFSQICNFIYRWNLQIDGQFYAPKEIILQQLLTLCTHMM